MLDFFAKKVGLYRFPYRRLRLLRPLLEQVGRIYGYETKNFNRQVRNNIEKFPEDMMFRLTKDELVFILRCKKIHLKMGRVTLSSVCLHRTMHIHALSSKKKKFR